MVCKGGYGTVRIVDLLDFTALKNSPNGLLVLVMTVLHNHLNTLGFKSIHGIMPITAPRATTQAIETLRMALFEKTFLHLLLLGKIKQEKLRRISWRESVILYSLFGSPSAIDCSDKIIY
jgi:muramoyltetrapeptide carboxypeptidase